jgi:hypothetical protein
VLINRIMGRVGFDAGFEADAGEFLLKGRA